MTGEAQAGWSPNGSPASIDASSITHAPSSGPVCRPGESRTVAMNLTARSFSFWSTAVHGWRRARGCVRVMVGTSSRDLPLRRTLSQGGARC